MRAGSPRKGRDPYETVAFRSVASEIRNPDGSVVFAAENVEVPAEWSQVACDILAQKYLRKAGVPARLAAVEEDGVPPWLWRRRADTDALAALPKPERSGGETSAKQCFDRLAGTWTYWGWKGGYFDAESDALAFYDELRVMLARQMGAPNSPQWFNTGLYWAYGIDGPAQGHYYVDHRTGKVRASDSAYEHPQPHACFIQSVADDLVNEGGIMDLWVREARLFKYGSGTGSNFSKLRADGEKLSGGGRSSGLMSFLRIGDRAAGAIKSGGTTRRAAKMVIVDADHPDIEQYIDWKVVEEQKVAALVAGSKLAARHLNRIMRGLPVEHGGPFDPAQNPALKREIRAARRAMIPENYIRRVIQLARQGQTQIDFKVYDTDWESEAYVTVAGQNANNTVRVTNDFLDRVETGADWQLTRRTDGAVTKTMPARALWDKIAHAAWASADPGLQFDTTINDWHTCPASGRINASNPCSEYMFLDDTACNLASLNLLAFLNEDGPEGSSFAVEDFRHAVRLWTIVLEISVMMAQFPSREIARLSYAYRTLGLGYANLGGLLMASGIPYDSDSGRAIAAAITALLTGTSYATSAEMAGELGPFPGFEKNRDAMLRVIRNHRRAAHGHADGYDALAIAPVPLDRAACPRPAARRSRRHGMGCGALARRTARLPQRAGLGDRADRHDRPRDGLRHDRHRTRFRAGQVQEAGRRRLFQDHEPPRAAGLARARLRRRRDRRYRALRPRPRHAEGRPGGQPRDARRQGLRRRRSRRDRSRARRGLRHQVRVQQMDARRSVPDRKTRHRGRPPRRSRLRPAIRRSASRAPRSTPPTPSAAAR